MRPKGEASRRESGGGKAGIELLLVAGTVALAGCGGGGGAAVCGDGVVQKGEDCDRGPQNGQAGIACNADCKSISVLIPQVQVNWSLLAKTGVAGYQGSGCGGVGAETAHVVLAGPTDRFDEMLPCLGYSKLYASNCPGSDGGACNAHLPPGDYRATVTLLDGNGAPLTAAVTTPKKTVVPGPPANLTVDFEMGDFTKAYTGSLQVRTSWGSDGANCVAATPPVAKESLVLVPAAGGPPVTGATLPGAQRVSGTPLDGTPADCYVPDNAHPTEEAKDIPWGAYRLTIEGYGASSVTEYCGGFSVFIGPGDRNQAWYETVPAWSPRDGGMGDGGPASDGGGASGCP